MFAALLYNNQASVSRSKATCSITTPLLLEVWSNGQFGVAKAHQPVQRGTLTAVCIAAVGMPLHNLYAHYKNPKLTWNLTWNPTPKDW